MVIENVGVSTGAESTKNEKLGNEYYELLKYVQKQIFFERFSAVSRTDELSSFLLSRELFN